MVLDKGVQAFERMLRPTSDAPAPAGGRRMRAEAAVRSRAGGGW